MLYLVIGFLVGYGDLLIFFFWIAHRLSFDAEMIGTYLFLNTLFYTALSFGYFMIVNLNIASLRLRLLKELLKNPGEGTML